jgi:hypothetical protein
MLCFYLCNYWWRLLRAATSGLCIKEGGQANSCSSWIIHSRTSLSTISVKLLYVCVLCVCYIYGYYGRAEVFAVLLLVVDCCSCPILFPAVGISINGVFPCPPDPPPVTKGNTPSHLVALSHSK